MRTHRNNTSENSLHHNRRESESVANALSSKFNPRQASIQFMDNRQEATAQRKLMQQANNDHRMQRAFQITDNRPEATAQRKLQGNINNSQVIQMNGDGLLGGAAYYAREAAGYVGGALSGIWGGVTGVVNEVAKRRRGDDLVFPMSAGLEGMREGFEHGYNHPTKPILAGAAGTAMVAGMATGYAYSGAGMASVSAMGPAVALGALNRGRHDGSNDRKTEITHTTGYVDLIKREDGEDQITRHKVGKKMEARLSANDIVQGSATGVNWTWMQELRAKYPYANVVRGHLLNHDLGGVGMPENLYPISTAANQAHSAEVEQNVKKLLAYEIYKSDQGEPSNIVNYRVEVIENGAPHDPRYATFKCTYYTEGTTPVTKSIHSDLGSDVRRAGGGHKDNPLDRTGWYHKKRSGYEDEDLRREVDGYKQNKNIRIREEAGAGLTENTDAMYTQGAGLRKVTEGLIIDNLFERLPRLDRYVQNLLIERELEGKKGNFKKSVIDFVRNSPGYAQVRNNVNDFERLVITILMEMTAHLHGSYKGDYEAEIKRILSKYHTDLRQV